ncbi:molybdopterin molybdotransferase MoeA [soil metagenome]
MSTTVYRPELSADLLSLERARARMLDGLRSLPVASVELDAAHGRVLAEPVDSLLTLPPWDNSAMDGFAVRAADVAGATRDAPVTLSVAGEAAAGRAATAAVGPGSAVRILTGAPLPDGADAVVPVELTDIPPGAGALPERVVIFAPIAAGGHIRRAGSDLQAGRRVLEAGTELGSAQLAVVAAAGHGVLRVHRPPRVALLSTGDELVPAGTTPGPAQIPDSNSVGLGALARESGAEARALGIATDDLDDVIGRLREGLDWADVIVVSGGVSVGARDVVKDAFASVGQIDLWRVAVQPGKPLAFGRATGVPGEVLLFGLHSNPVSSLVTFELFVRPVLRRLAGHADVLGRQVVRARLTDDVTKSPGRRAFLRVKLDETAEGDFAARLAGGQDSHVLSALAAADGLAIIPEEQDGLPAGSEVEVIRIR